MAYVKQNWENLPSTNTPITAERLNHMEDGIAEAWEHGGGGAGETLKIGTILPYTGSDSELPTGYMLCDGSELSRTDYSDLFAVIGTSFGDGNGSSTFNLPNLKGKVLTGLDSNDTDFASMGTTGGEKTHTLTISEMPSHSHNAVWQRNSGDVGLGEYGGNVAVQGTPASPGMTQGVTTTTGGGQSHNILQPYVVVNYIIKVTQSSPVQAQIVGTYTESATDGYSCNYVNRFIPVELYNDTTGTDGDVTLSDSVSNYSYLEIYGYESINNTQVYAKYDLSLSKDLNLFGGSIQQSGNLFRITASSYTVSGTTLTKKSANTGHANIFTKTINEQNSKGDIKITKVLGIK